MKVHKMEWARDNGVNEVESEWEWSGKKIVTQGLWAILGTKSSAGDSEH